MVFNKNLLVGLVCCLTGFVFSASVFARRPNVVVILTDDKDDQTVWKREKCLKNSLNTYKSREIRITQNHSKFSLIQRN